MCVLAGGLGTRLGEQVRTVPKPLVEVAGEPFLYQQLRLLRRHGARRVVMCVGYLGERIEAAVGDGRRFGVDVAYSYDGPEPAGTAGAVRQALPLLGDPFLVLYGDTYLRIDYRAVEAALRASGLAALMTVLRNEDRWDRSNAVLADGRVARYDKRRRTSDMKWIDYGLGALRPEALDTAGPGESDLSEVYRRLAEQGRLAAFEARERFYEIGTAAALAETDAFLRAQGRGGVA